MMLPSSSPSVLASSSRHNIMAQDTMQLGQKSMRLFLGVDSDLDDEDFINEDARDDRSLPGFSPSQADSAAETRYTLPQTRKTRKLSSPSKSLSTSTSLGIMTSPTKRQKTFLVRGNVTPSKAFSIFKAAKQRRQQHSVSRHGMMTPPSSSPRALLDYLDDTSPSKRHRSNASSSSLFSTASLQSGFLSSPSAANFTPRRYPVSMSSFAYSRTGNNLPSAMNNSDAWSSSHTSRLHRGRARLNAASFLETIVSPSTSRYQIPSGRAEVSHAHPISAAYSYSSRSVNPSAQWLAVGDDEGQITLVNTLPAQDFAAETYTSNPQWVATPDAAVFELTWRFDDRVLLSGSSDYSIRSWDTEYQTCTGAFLGHTGSPRTIVYDPTTNGDGGCGNIFASAGRDGTIRIWDARVDSKTCGHCSSESQASVLSINAAHAPTLNSKSRRGSKRSPAVRTGVTALAYLPDGNGHKLLSGGSYNAVVKCWDLRKLLPDAASETDLEAQQIPTDFSNTWATPDLSLLSAGLHRRSHGLSQIIASSTNLYAASTGGRVYTLPLASFLDRHFDSSGVQTLYDPIQCQNTLFSRMALFNDQFLAVGCNSGDIALWDVRSKNASARADNDDGRDIEEESSVANDLNLGIGYQSRQSKAVILAGGHANNTEVNSVAWANGPNGPTLSSVGDDTNVRSWYPDRALREHVVKLSQI